MRPQPKPCHPLPLAAAAVLLLCAALPAAAADEVVTPALVSTYAGGLNFPASFVFAPDGTLFFLERLTGAIRALDTSTNPPQLVAEPVGQVTSLGTEGEEGLLGLALDPEWPRLSWMYLYYTHANASAAENRIVRMWVDNLKATYSEVIFDGIPASYQHNGGVIAFGPDGKLWALTGDALNPAASQDPSTLNGKVLRLERDGSVPADNPFPGSPVYSYGHRNMFGIAFNPVTGVPYVSENGPADFDELNRILPGRNYGWPNVTGFAGDPNFEDPLWAFHPVIAPTGVLFDASRSATTDFVDFLVASWNTGQVTRYVLAAPHYDHVVSEELVSSPNTPLIGLAHGPDGRLYLSTYHAILVTNPPAYQPSPAGVQIAVSKPATRMGEPITFSAVSLAAADSPAAYVWDFGDGSTGTQPSVDHAYEAPGVYEVHVSVYVPGRPAGVDQRQVFVSTPQAPVASILIAPPEVEVGLPVMVSGLGSWDMDNDPLSFVWDFGDGTSDEGAVVNHTYAAAGTYTVRLEARDPAGAVGYDVAQVGVHAIRRNLPPTARIATPQTVVTAGTFVGFDATESVDPDGHIAEVVWQFPDGTVAQNARVLFAFGQAGIYEVHLRVTDDANASAVASVSIVVIDPALPHRIGDRTEPAPLIPIALAALAASVVACAWVSRRR